jgi:hypothetical protein
MDKEAIALYVAAGNPREDWTRVDECVRLHYRRQALQSTRHSMPEPVLQPQGVLAELSSRQG